MCALCDDAQIVAIQYKKYVVTITLLEFTIRIETCMVQKQIVYTVYRFSWGIVNNYSNLHANL
jgi:hypothetical protein